MLSLILQTILIQSTLADNCAAIQMNSAYEPVPLNICSFDSSDFIGDGPFSSGYYCSDNNTVIYNAYNTTTCSGDPYYSNSYSCTSDNNPLLYCNCDKNAGNCSTAIRSYNDCNDTHRYYSQILVMNLCVDTDNNTASSQTIKCDSNNLKYIEYDATDCNHGSVLDEHTNFIYEYCNNCDVCSGYWNIQCTNMDLSETLSTYQLILVIICPIALCFCVCIVSLVLFKRRRRINADNKVSISPEAEPKGVTMEKVRKMVKYVDSDNIKPQPLEYEDVEQRKLSLKNRIGRHNHYETHNYVEIEPEVTHLYHDNVTAGDKYISTTVPMLIEHENYESVLQPKRVSDAPPEYEDVEPPAYYEGDHECTVHSNEGQKSINVKEWFKNDVDLDGNEYKEIYYNIFIEQGFGNLKAIKLITDEDLKDIGIDKMGHRKVILNSIKHL